MDLLGSLSFVERSLPADYLETMEIKIESRFLRDVVVLVPDVFQDTRGFFMETFRKDQFIDNGLPTDFVQDNHSRSTRGVVRGLHFQWDPPMGKLMRVSLGSAFSCCSRHSQRIADTGTMGWCRSIG
jgi:dTDP-4-dehydrorhamnose 3,5-epimerase-like enzyme